MVKFGLIGTSLTHSFSKKYFESIFLKENKINYQYDLIELPSIKDFLALLEKKDYKGFNVTIPFKEAIIPFLDSLSLVAQEVGAVNVVSYEEGKWVGYNTDVFGFRQSIKPFLTNQHEKALIFGTGGAAKAVKFALNQLGIETLFITSNKTTTKITTAPVFEYHEVNEFMIHACKLIVNCTPLGTNPNTEKVSMPYNSLTSEHLIVDLVYNPSETPFLAESKKFGATILNGKSMLLEQANEAWRIWNK